MSKKKLFFIITLLFAVSFIGGACGYFGIAYIKAGGTAEGALDYIEKTVIPEIFPAGVFIITVYIASKPIISKVQGIISKLIGAIGAFDGAGDKVEAVRESGKQSVDALNKATDELILLNTLFEAGMADMKNTFTAQISELQAAVSNNTVLYERVKEGLRIAFTNDSDLVRNGYARQIYNAFEGIEQEHTTAENGETAGAKI